MASSRDGGCFSLDDSHSDELFNGERDGVNGQICNAFAHAEVLDGKVRGSIQQFQAR